MSIGQVFMPAISSGILCKVSRDKLCFLEMKQDAPKLDSAWRKSRLAARLLLRKEAGRMRPRDQVLARRLSQDPEVSNRLIQQALYFLGIGPRKNAFDRKLVDGRD